MQLGSSLPALLEFTLKATEDVIEGEATLSRRPHASAHATHTNETLRLHSRAALGAVCALSSVETEPVAGTCARVAVLMVIREGVARRVLALLLLFRASGCLHVLLGKYTDDPGRDLVVDDGLVVLANNIDSKFLMNISQ